MKKIFTLILVTMFALHYPIFSFAQQDGNKISLDIKGMDILDVFKILSMRSDLNIIAGRNVRGNVTMFLKDVDVWDAFEIILAANDLAYEKRGNIISVMTQRDYELLYGEKYQDRRVLKTVKLKYARAEDVAAALSQIKTNIGRVVADEPSKSILLMDVPYKVEEMEEIIKNLDTPVITKVYELKYAKVKDVKDKITEVLSKNIGSLQIDERTNKMAITDTEKKIAQFDEVIAAFDEKHREVEIEAAILELTLNDEYRSGIDWDVVFQQLSRTLSRTFGDQVFNFDFSQSLTTGMTYRIGDVGSKGFQAVIQFLQRYGKTKILSNPRITVLNNEEAKILIGKNQPYVTTTVSQVQGSSSTAANVIYLDLGVKLTVTPTINKDGFITMKVKPEISSSSSSVEYTISEGVKNTVPIVETSTTETIVMIKDNNTIMLSGLIQKRDEKDVSKTPGLGDIPILGNLFKKTTKGNASEPERKEIIIFLTPRIVYGENEKRMEEIKEKRQEQKLQQQLLQEKHKGEKIQDTLVDSERQALEKEAKEGPVVWNEHMKPSDYYKLIWQRVNERIIINKPKRRVPGEVLVSFILTSDGKLAGEPSIFTFPDTDAALVEIALNSVKEAAPFPLFPSTIRKKTETFSINISYE